MKEKICVINADPLRPAWGLDSHFYETLKEQVDIVMSCASSTEYTPSYLQLREHWLFNLLQTLQFCIEGNEKHLTYLGSVGARFYSNSIDFIRPDSWWYSGYAQMKWVNGEILKWLSHDGILPVTLCEASYIFGSTTLGKDPGLHYSWWRLIEMAKNIGMMWEGQGLNYSPVDILVDSLVVNALSSQPISFIQPCNPFPYDNSLYAELLNCKLVPWEEFKQQALKIYSERRLNDLLSEDMSELIQRANNSAVFPIGYPSSWCDNQKLMRLFLNNVPFRAAPKNNNTIQLAMENNSAPLLQN